MQVAPGSDGGKVKRAMLTGKTFTKWDSLLLVVRSYDLYTF